MFIPSTEAFDRHNTVIKSPLALSFELNTLIIFILSSESI